MGSVFEFFKTFFDKHYYSHSPSLLLYFRVYDLNSQEPYNSTHEFFVPPLGTVTLIGLFFPYFLCSPWPLSLKHREKNSENQGLLERK